MTLAISKSFDHVHWGSLWQALRQHEVSDHMVWILQCLYHNQVGTVLSSSGTSHPFDIRQGVRQGCVLSPRLFVCVLQWALRSWRATIKHHGLNLGMGWHHFWIFALRTVYFFLRFHLVVLGIEVGGRWSNEASNFIRMLANARARSSPPSLQAATRAALVSRWSALLTRAAATSFAASLLFEDLSPHHNLDGDLPALGHLLAHASPAVPASRLPAR